jgi:predicted DNA-binding transcriptional regulator AlpA
MTSNTALPAQSDPDWLDRLIDEQEAANFLGYSVRALQNWRLRGGGPQYVRVSRRSVRYRRRELIRWAEGKLEAHTSERELPEQQTSRAQPGTSEAAAGEAVRPGRPRAPVTRPTAPAQAKASPEPVAKPAQTEPASKPPQERKRNPFDPFNLLNS